MSAWVQPCWPWCSSSLRAAESAVATLRSPPRQRWFGFALLLDYVFYASLFGGVLTLAIIYFRGVPLPQVFVGLSCAERLHRSGVPYGIALVAAALVIYPHTHWMAAIGR